MWIMIRQSAMCMVLAGPCVNYAQKVGYIHGFRGGLCGL